MQRASGARKRAPSHSKFKKVLLQIATIFVFFIFIVALTWFFALPAILQNWYGNKNIIILSQEITESKSNNAIYLVRNDADASKKTVFKFSGDMLVTLPGYGEYALGSVAPLLKIDGKDTWSTRSTFGAVFGVLIDEVYVTNESFLSKITVDYLLRGENLIELDSIPKIDEKRKLLFDLSAVAKNTCSLAIINGSSQVGVATNFSGLLEKNGGIVVRVDSLPADSHVVNTVYAEEDCLLFAQKATYFLPTKPEFKQKDLLPTFSEYRADVVIVLTD